MCFRVFTCSKTSPHPHLYRSSWIKSEQGPVPSRTSIDGFKGKSTGNHDLSPIFRGFLDHLPIIQFCALKAQLFFPVLPLGQANLCSSSPDLSMSEKVATRPAGSVYAAAYCACPGLQKSRVWMKEKTVFWVCWNRVPPNRFTIIFTINIVILAFLPVLDQAILLPSEERGYRSLNIRSDLGSAQQGICVLPLAKLEKARAF